MKSQNIDSEAAQKIDAYIASLPAWQATNLTQFRELVHRADPAITEDWKWNVPVFLLEGKMIFAMSAFKAHTKYNFIENGALLEDPSGLFNNGLDSVKARSIDIREGETVDLDQLASLITAAVQLSQAA